MVQKENLNYLKNVFRFTLFQVGLNAVVTEHPINVVTEHPINVVTKHPINVITEHPINVVTEHPINVVTEHPINDPGITLQTQRCCLKVR